jgi:hypothetical protein
VDVTVPEFADRLRRELQRSVRDVTAPEGHYERARLAGIARWRRRRRHVRGAVGIAIVVAATLVVVVTQGALSPASRQQVQTLGPPPARTATPAEYRALARREASHLLSLVQLPHGAVPTSHPGAGLAQAINGIPPGTLDVIRTWTVSEPYHSTLAWLDGHLPKGARIDAGDTRTDKGVVTFLEAGYILFAPAGVAWSAAELEVAATAAGPQHTAIRVDADVSTLNPDPQKDTDTGSRVHVTVAGGCPPSVRGDQDVRNPSVDLTATLLPPGTPTGGLLCGYGDQFTLKQDRRLRASESQKLAREAQAVPLSHPAIYPKTVPRFIGECGEPAGEDWILVFAYSNHPDVDLWLYPDSCTPTLDNGQITADQDGKLAKLGYPQSLKP